MFGRERRKRLQLQANPLLVLLCPSLLVEFSATLEVVGREEQMRKQVGREK